MNESSVATVPIHLILERLAGHVAAQVVTKKIHASVEAHVCLAGDVGRDEHPRVVPQAAVRIALEFPTVNVERGPTDSAVGQPLQEGGLVDAPSSSHVDHYRTRSEERRVGKECRSRW